MDLTRLNDVALVSYGAACRSYKFLVELVLSGKSWYPMRNVHGHEFTHAAASCGAMREPNLLRADPALCGESAFVV